MATDVVDTAAMHAARRSYEIGRARVALVRGAVAATAVAVVALAVVGASALPWVGATFVAAAFAEWRGGALALGARRGVIAGAITLVLPLSILRPCCTPGAEMVDGASCCTMPQACLAAGAVIGLGLALLLPRLAGATAARRVEAAVGMAIGVVSVAAIRCAPLFLGEAAGLLGGLVAGVAIATLANALVARRAMG